MPRPVGRPARYRATPLYKLRKTIGGSVPMTQVELSKLIDTPLPTLKWLGNRPMSRALMQKIWFATGAIWEEQKKRWLYDLWWLGAHEKSKRFTPLTAALFTEHHELLSSASASLDPEQDLTFMHVWLDQLFRHAPKDRWMQLRQRYRVFVEECCRDFELGAPDNIFEAARG